MNLFNILTPSYNRAHTLSRVYESLLNQSIKDFKWIIVDDGSTDNTEELIKNWQLEKRIDIECYKLKENKGKPKAVNFGLNYCTNKFTIIADSDDSFVSNTLSDLKLLWKTIGLLNHPQKIASIWTLVNDENGNIIGDYFPQNMWQVNFKERMLKRNIKGEKWHCWRTSVLKENNLFFDDKCHISESATWNKINRKFDFLCVNIAHRCYYSSPDGIIATIVPRKQTARMRYYNSYYELKNVSLSHLIFYRHYRHQAFDHIKSLFYIKDEEMKITGVKKILAAFIFIGFIPSRILKKIR